MKIKHPSLPLEMEAANYGVVLIIGGKLVGNIARTEFGPLTQRQIEAVKRQGKNPDEFRAATESHLNLTLGPVSLAWLLEHRPALLAYHLELKAKDDAVIEKRQADQAAREAPLLAAMTAEIEEKRRQIPSDRVEITVEHKGDFDGYPNLDLSYQGTPLHLLHDEVKLEAAHAIHPGALGAFRSVYIGHCSPSSVAAAKARAADKVAAAEKNQADALTRKNRSVPAEAIKAYRECRGNPENFPDDIDHPSYWLVKEWAGAIEHQGLARSATMDALSAEANRVARENPSDE